MMQICRRFRALNLHTLTKHEINDKIKEFPRHNTRAVQSVAPVHHCITHGGADPATPPPRHPTTHGPPSGSASNASTPAISRRHPKARRGREKAAEQQIPQVRNLADPPQWGEASNRVTNPTSSPLPAVEQQTKHRHCTALQNTPTWIPDNRCEHQMPFCVIKLQ